MNALIIIGFIAGVLMAVSGSYFSGHKEGKKAMLLELYNTHVISAEAYLKLLKKLEKQLTAMSIKQCINKSGLAKKTFKTFEEAVEWAKNQNENPRTIHKQVAYKCRYCLKFHTGRSIHNTLLTHNTNIYDQTSGA